MKLNLELRTRKMYPGQRERKVLFFLLVIVCLCLLFFNSAEAKVLIDISSPAIRKLPVSINTKGPARAKEIEWIIKNDLETTGMFEFVDPDVPGAEIRVNMDAVISDELKVILSITDLIEGREVIKKRLSAPIKTSIRALAHTVSNDIYKAATGKDGIFRTKLSYLVNSSVGKKDLQLMDWDGFNSFKITSNGLTASHSWSHDAGFLLYSTLRNRNWKIYTRDLRSGREKVLFSSSGLNLVGGTSDEDMISFSSSKEGSSEIYVINLDGQKLSRITRSFGIDVSPVFSPNGDKIAFVSDRGGTPQIYVVETDGSGLKRLTFEGTYNSQPSWSSDGKWIAFSGRTSGKFQIFMIQSDGKDLRQLTFEGNNESPSFSPDGMFIAFDSDRDRTRGIYIMRSNGEGQKRITPKKIKAMTPKWSPNYK